jgi:mono/diheme cytochrome c family protein
MLRRILTIAVLSFGVSLILYSIPSSMTTTAAQGKDKNARGRQLYTEYCASCHGLDGKGGGPVATSLKSALPDLTRIPLENGKFPSLRILQVIGGEVDVPAHGSKEMPVWGRYFRRRHGGSVSNLNVYALEKYIESIQQK